MLGEHSWVQLTWVYNQCMLGEILYPMMQCTEFALPGFTMNQKSYNFLLFNQIPCEKEVHLKKIFTENYLLQK